MRRIARPLLELDAGVDVLGVLAHDHEVEVVAQVARALVSLDRAHERIQVELLAQGHVDASEPGTDWRRDRSFDRDFVLANGGKHRLRERGAEFLDGGLARLVHIPIELDAGGFEHAHGRVADFRPDPVTRNEGYGMPRHY